MTQQAGALAAFAETSTGFLAPMPYDLPPMPAQAVEDHTILSHYGSREHICTIARETQASGAICNAKCLSFL